MQPFLVRPSTSDLTFITPSMQLYSIPASQRLISTSKVTSCAREASSHTFIASSRSLRDPKGPYCDIPKTAGAVAVPKTGFPAKAGVTGMIGVIGKSVLRGSSNALGRWAPFISSFGPKTGFERGIVGIVSVGAFFNGVGGRSSPFSL